jgi:hypothetical protein
MRALRDGRTSVLISHRLSTVRDASLIDSSPGTTMCSQVPGPESQAEAASIDSRSFGD